jgi:hypothetical protein
MIDWDESVYLLVARSTVEGSLPYVEVFSHKQPMLFLILTASFLLPDPVVGMRLVGCLAVTATAVGLGFITRRVVGGWIGPLVAILLTLLATAASGGLATNTEILFAPFIVLAFALVIAGSFAEAHDQRDEVFRFGFAGLLSGLAVQIKLVASFEAFALIVCSLVWMSMSQARTDDRPRQVLRRGLSFAIGAATPMAIALLVFGSFGQLGSYVFSNFGFNFAYTDLQSDRWSLFVAAMQRQAHSGNLLLFAVAVVSAAWLLSRARFRRDPIANVVVLSIAWFASAVAAVVVAAKYYDHHLLQPVPAATLLTSLAVARAFQDRRLIIRVLSAALLVCLLASQSTIAIRHLQQLAATPDLPREVAAILVEGGAAESIVFVANSQPVIYVLAEADAPSRYVLPAWYIRPEFRRRLGIDLDAFLDQVFEQRPRFVIVEQDHPWLPDRDFVELLIERYLADRYEPIARIGPVFVFRAVDEES